MWAPTSWTRTAQAATLGDRRWRDVREAHDRVLRAQLRAGLHTGEVELDGDDVARIAVAIGARVGALADPGEALVSSTVKGLVVGSRLSFTDRGMHTLKGVPDSWHLYAASDLR